MGTAGESPLRRPFRLDPALVAWLDQRAESLDTSAEHAGEVLARLGSAGLFRIGVPVQHDGDGGDIVDAIAAISAVAEHSVTTAFVFWAQRTFIEYLLHSPNTELRERWLPSLLQGGYAGATGLSNAMKFLSGIESLQIRAVPTAASAAGTGWRLEGKLPWVTNLRREGFIVAAAVNCENDALSSASIFALPHDAAGIQRTPDLNLMALRGSNTAALHLDGVALGAQWQLHPDALIFLRTVRPSFLGMQCGLSIGLIRRSLAEAQQPRDATRSVIEGEIAAVSAALEDSLGHLESGLAAGVFHTQPAALFEIRIALADCANHAVRLELQAGGGRGYLRDTGCGFQRRWREVAFVPIVTPSLLQLKSQLNQHSRGAKP